MNRWLLGARVRTLPAAVVPVVVGTCAAVGGRPVADVRWGNAIAAMIVALSLQVATNLANDYSDGVRGTDDPGSRVGPPRLVGSGMARPGEVKRAMLLAFGAALIAGSVLVVTVGWELIPVGLASVAAGWFYTGGPRPYGYAGMGEAFVFVFFGLVATVGSAYVQLETITWLSVGCGVMIGSFATALLVVNNLRDIPGDTLSGKRTLAVRLGDRRTRLLYGALMAVPYLVLPFVAGLSGRPAAALAYAAIAVTTKPLLAVLSGASGAALIPVLGQTSRAELVFGALCSVGLLFVV
ncbi:MAG TPA: 1,4-dihydroxy-2-naphthoate polyprenyltransferase [Microthrixaceae bacterium]|nr:1,4-dihydroxy-2-naphthoate polyprenyltransferase [Microthrixaceae bacterium]